MSIDTFLPGGWRASALGLDQPSGKAGNDLPKGEQIVFLLATRLSHGELSAPSSVFVLLFGARPTARLGTVVSRLGLWCSLGHRKSSENGFLWTKPGRARRSDLQSIVVILASFGCSRRRPQGEDCNIIAFQGKRSYQFHLRWDAIFSIDVGPGTQPALGALGRSVPMLGWTQGILRCREDDSRTRKGVGAVCRPRRSRPASGRQCARHASPAGELRNLLTSAQSEIAMLPTALPMLRLEAVSQAGCAPPQPPLHDLVRQTTTEYAKSLQVQIGFSNALGQIIGRAYRSQSVRILATPRC